MNFKKAKQQSEDLLKVIKPHCLKAEIAGSIRRQEETVKDIEIICVPKCYGQSKRRISQWIYTVYNMGKILQGKLGLGKHIRIQLPNTIILDLFVVQPGNWGMQYLLRTGPADYSKHILYCFNKMGYSSKGGYPIDKYGNSLEFFEEDEVYEFLDLPFLPAESRKRKVQKTVYLKF